MIFTDTICPPGAPQNEFWGELKGLVCTQCFRIATPKQNLPYRPRLCGQKVAFFAQHIYGYASLGEVTFYLSDSSPEKVMFCFGVAMHVPEVEGRLLAGHIAYTLT